jgi:hypothetical protein
MLLPHAKQQPTQNQKRKCKEASHLSLIIARSTVKAEEAIGERAEKPDHLKKENPTKSAQIRNPTKSIGG